MSGAIEFKHSEKQVEILRLILGAADKGYEISLQELHGKLSYTASQQALQCSLRILEKHGMVERLRRPVKGVQGRQTFLRPLPAAYSLFRGA